MDVKRKRKIRIALIIVILAAVYCVGVIYNQQKIIASKSNQLDEMNAKIEAETQVNQELLKEKANMLTEEYVKRIARERLGMICPGEKVYVDTNR